MAAPSALSRNEATELGEGRHGGVRVGVDGNGQAPRLLVVDDEPNIVDMVRMALRFHGFEVATATASCGAEATFAVTTDRPDLLLLDVMLPDADGFDLCRQWRAQGLDVSEIVRDAVADAAAVEPDRPLVADVPDGCRTVGDPDALRQVLGNLLANVRAHTPPGTPAEVSLAQLEVAEVEVAQDSVGGGLRVEIQVRDRGPGVAPGELDRIFDRFFRSSAGRSRPHGQGGDRRTPVEATTDTATPNRRAETPGRENLAPACPDPGRCSDRELAPTTGARDGKESL